MSFTLECVHLRRSEVMSSLRINFFCPAAPIVLYAQWFLTFESDSFDPRTMKAMEDLLYRMVHNEYLISSVCRAIEELLDGIDRPGHHWIIHNIPLWFQES